MPGTALGLRFRTGAKRQAGLPGRTGYDLRLPIHDETGLVEAFARLQLPTRIQSDRTGHHDAVSVLALGQHPRIGVARVDEVLAGKQLARFERSLNDRQFVLIRRGPHGRQHIGDQVGTGAITGLGSDGLYSRPRAFRAWWSSVLLYRRERRLTPPRPLAPGQT